MAGFNVGDKNSIRARIGIVTAEYQTGCGNRMEGIGAGLETVDLKHLAGGYVGDAFIVPERFSIYVRVIGGDVGGVGDDCGDGDVEGGGSYGWWTRCIR